MWGGQTVRLRRLWNLVTSLPRDARLFDALGVGELARWGIDQEMAWMQIQLLDLVARRGSKRTRPLVTRSLRPKTRTRVESMSSAAAHRFFGG